jgi:uracil-DNA glycosylase family 4
MTLIPNLNTALPDKPSAKNFNALKVQCPPTDNAITASYAIVGEAPNSIEIMEQEPFSGPMGNQFKRICAAVQLPTYSLYLTHACKAQLPNNNTNKLWTAKGFRCFEWPTLQNRLISELATFPGRIIILMGDTPMRLLLDEPKIDNINKYRGSVYRAEDFPHLADKLAGKFICLSLHPSTSLRRAKPVNFYIIMADLKKFMELDDDPTLLEDEPIIHTRPNLHQVLEFYDRVKQQPETGFDIEATPKYVTCFSLSIGSDEAMSIPLMHNGGNYWSPEDEDEIWCGLAEILISPDVGIVCQNGMFDIMFVLRTLGIKTDCFSFDTMLAQHICWTDLPKGLDFLTSAYTYFPYYKDEGKLSHQAAIKDWDMYWKYNAKDAAYLPKIKKRLIQELEAFGATKDMEYTMALHKPLMEMEFNGILTEPDAIAAEKKRLQRKIAALYHGLHKVAGKPLNINSPKQMTGYFYGDLLIKPYINRVTKRPTCDAVALSRIARKNSKGSIEAKFISKIRTYHKLVSTYFSIPVDADKRLRCSHKISGTESGRIATEKTFFGTGANLQNQPYAFAKYLVADKDYIFIEFDLAKAEAHCVAFLAQDANMIEAFESGVDVHSFNAAQIFGVKLEAVTKKMRQMGKKVVHASNYNMGPQTFSDNLAKENTFMSQRECKHLLTAYQKRFPGLKRWHKSIDDEVMRTRMLYNMYGRPRRFLGDLNAATFRTAYSFIPQSTVAELMNKGLIAIANDPVLAASSMQLLTTVHDSGKIQVHRSEWKDLSTIFNRILTHMTHEFTHKGRSFTIGTDFTIGSRWCSHNVELESIDQGTINKGIKELGI